MCIFEFMKFKMYLSSVGLMDSNVNTVIMSIHLAVFTLFFYHRQKKTQPRLEGLTWGLTQFAKEKFIFKDKDLKVESILVQCGFCFFYVPS